MDQGGIQETVPLLMALNTGETIIPDVVGAPKDG